MKFGYFPLAHRYAQAFLNVFYPEPFQAPLESYKKLLALFYAKPGIMSLVATCPCPQSCYNLMEDFLIKKFGLSILEKKLFHLLLVNHHISMLTVILERLIDLEHARRGELVCTIELSHKISDTSLQELVTTFESMTHKKLIPNVVLKPSLICGVRMYTKTLSYERSINKTLNNAHAFAVTKGGLW